MDDECESASDIAKGDELQLQVHGVRNVVEELVKVSLEVSYHWSKVSPLFHHRAALLGQKLYHSLFKRNQYRNYQKLMDLATNYEQWEAAATMLDYLDGWATMSS